MHSLFAPGYNLPHEAGGPPKYNATHKQDKIQQLQNTFPNKAPTNGKETTNGNSSTGNYTTEPSNATEPLPRERPDSH